VPDQRTTWRTPSPQRASMAAMVEVSPTQASTALRSLAITLTRRWGQGRKVQAQRWSAGRCRRARRTERAAARPSPLGPTRFWMRWPEASAARSQFRFAISRSRNLSPTAVRTKGMPASPRAWASPPLVMSVPTTPGGVSPQARRSWARSHTIWSPSTAWPRLSTSRQRSPSPSKAMPSWAPRATTAAARASRWVEPTPTLMAGPSAGTPIQWMVPPRKSSRAASAVAPWAQSMTTRKSPGRSMPPRWAR
jgi:hypothetical protein